VWRKASYVYSGIGQRVSKTSTYVASALKRAHILQDVQDVLFPKRFTKLEII
jgi:hypothetical protein